MTWFPGKKTYTFALAALHHKPDALAMMRGWGKCSRLRGSVAFYNSPYGVYVVSQFEGIPSSSDLCKRGIFALHIHDGTSCTGNAEDPFANAGMHYNPGGCPHPAHAGDLPPVFDNRGSSWNAVLTDRFRTQDIIGKAIILHSMPDDFRTQPSGDSGAKIACGIIVKG